MSNKNRVSNKKTIQGITIGSLLFILLGLTISKI